MRNLDRRLATAAVCATAVGVLERAVEALVGEGAYRVEIRRARAPEREARGARR